MTIGLPGSGKSTWAAMQKDCFVLSSDDYREKLFGDATDQTHNAEVFNALRKDAVKYLEEGRNVIYDATNMNIKDRNSILRELLHLFDVCTIAVVFATPIEVCKERNKNRSRVVPDFVYDKMIKRFEFPLLAEGFDDIVILHAPYSANSINPNELMNTMKEKSQNNPYHTKTVGNHCEDTALLLQEQTVYRKDKEAVSAYIAAKFHDLGKLWTETVDDNGISHYIGHENYGAYQSLFINWDEITPPNLSYIKNDITTLINYHMIPFRLKNASEKTKEKYKVLLKKYWYWIELIHSCDKAMSDAPFVHTEVGSVDMQELISECFSVG